MISHTLNSKFIHGLLAFAILFWIFVDVKAQHGCARDITVYTREILLDLRPGDLGPKPSGYEHFPRDIKPRKRGKRGGVQNRIMNRKSKPALPTILFGNVRSLPNKMDELRSSVRYMFEYRESCIMCFSETWLHDNIPDNELGLRNFQLLRSDRTQESGKSRGALYVHQ